MHRVMPSGSTTYCQCHRRHHHHCDGRFEILCNIADICGIIGMVLLYNAGITTQVRL